MEMKESSQADNLVFFQNEKIFFELDQLDRITHAWLGLNSSLTQAQKTF